MRSDLLTAEEVLSGYDAVARIYPHVPPLCIWRAWEHAAYRRFSLPEPVLDVGCGDGRFFRLVWPDVTHAVGVEVEPGVARAAQESGVYRDVFAVPAWEIPELPFLMGSAFANCSLEHMDRLRVVLAGIAQRLSPGAPFLLSVITDKWSEWLSLPWVLNQLGEGSAAERLRSAYTSYQHHVNVFPPDRWARELETAGFSIQSYIPIVPEKASLLFLLLDQLWHVPIGRGELGDLLSRHAARMANFTPWFRHLLSEALQMESNWTVGSGAIFLARQR